MLCYTSTTVMSKDRHINSEKITPIQIKKEFRMRLVLCLLTCVCVCVRVGVNACVVKLRCSFIMRLRY